MKMLGLLFLGACVAGGSIDGTTPGGPRPSPEPPSCAPQATVIDPTVLEGEIVVIELRCTSGETRAPFDAVVVNAPGGQLDIDTWRYQWTPTLADAGRYDILWSVTPKDGGSGLPETTISTIWVADAWDRPGNTPVDAMRYDEEWGIPVLHLGPAAPLGENYVTTSIVFQGRGITGEMKKRGAASLGYPKNSYTLHAISDELDTGPLGLGRVDRLVLITSFDDASYVRQKLTYDLWAAMAEHQGEERLCPRTEFVVVYLDGRFWGLYTAADHPDDDFLREMGLEEGGSLYKAVTHDANFRRTDADGWPKSFLSQGYDKAEGEPDDWSDLEALVAWVADSSVEIFQAEHEDWMQISEWMDWFLFAHYAMLEDSAGKNAYLYDDPGTGLWRYIPWDMNHSWGQGWYPYPVGSDGEPDYHWNNEVFVRISSSPALRGLQEERRQDLMDDGPFRAAWAGEQVEGYYARIAEVAARDWEKWGQSYRDYWDLPLPDWEVDRAAIEAWIQDRAVWEEERHP
jgi:hypothetical protein